MNKKIRCGAEGCKKIATNLIEGNHDRNDGGDLEQSGLCREHSEYYKNDFEMTRIKWYQKDIEKHLVGNANIRHFVEVNV